MLIVGCRNTIFGKSHPASQKNCVNVKHFACVILCSLHIQSSWFLQTKISRKNRQTCYVSTLLTQSSQASWKLETFSK